MAARIIETSSEPLRQAEVDPITLDLIESGLINARDQMDAVLFRTAMSPIIREQRDGFPILTDRLGRLHAGQFGSCVQGFLDGYEGVIEDGDILLTSDPYACNGSVSHVNDWLVCMPVYYRGKLINWSAMFGHQTDIGGRAAGSMPVDSTDLYQEGICIPPIKIFSRGEFQKDVLKVILHNCRKPVWNESDLNALIASARVGRNRCLEMAERFGVDVFVSALDRLLERNHRSMRQLILDSISEKKVYFEDYIDDDAMGEGPYKLACHLWRENDKMIFDFGGTDRQSRGNINFLLSDQMFKMFCGQFMVNMFDPQILLNDGFFPLVEVRIPEGSILRPIRPAALTGRTHALGRIFDIISGLFGANNPEYMCAAGFSDSPHFIYSGYDSRKNWFLLFQIGFGGVPGRPGGDGADGHSLWPKFRNIPNEFIEAYYPVRVERFETIPNTGGAGKHRGGNAVRYVYTFLSRGEISVHDDRWLTYPWGVNGGSPGARGTKTLLRADGTRQVLPAKVDRIYVEPGDGIVFDTWGGGGWGDPLQRELAAIAYDLESGLITAEGLEPYGVVLRSDSSIDVQATNKRRMDLAQERGPIEVFNRGGTVEELRARCFDETGLPPPKPPMFHDLVR